jgi:hypothetical protein
MERDWKTEKWNEIKEVCDTLSDTYPEHICTQVTMKEFLDDDEVFERYVSQTHKNNPTLGGFKWVDGYGEKWVQTHNITDHPLCKFEPIAYPLCFDKSDADALLEEWNQYTTTTATTAAEATETEAAEEEQCSCRSALEKLEECF